MTLDSGWRFTAHDIPEGPQAEAASWLAIAMPHTWNAVDGADGADGDNLIQAVGRRGEVLVRDECQWKLRQRTEQANQTRGGTDRVIR